MSEPNIRVENSAPSQRRSAFSVRWSAPLLRKCGARRVVDYGAGALRNLKTLERYFEEIALVETPKQCQRLAPRVRGKNHVALYSSSEFEKNGSTFDAVFLICILHTIPDLARRRQIIEIAVRHLRPGGFIIVDVPQAETYYSRRRSRLKRHTDGYLLKWGSTYTFYKSFLRAEFDAMFEQTRSLMLFRKVGYTKHLIRIWRKIG